MAEYLPDRPKLSEIELDQYLKALVDDQVKYCIDSVMEIYYVVENFVMFVDFRLISFAKQMTVEVEPIP